MCGIIAVLGRASERPPPDAEQVIAALELAEGAIALGHEGLLAAATHVEAVDRSLRGVPGVTALVESPDLATTLRRRMDALHLAVGEVDQRLDSGALRLPAREM